MFPSYLATDDRGRDANGRSNVVQACQKEQTKIGKHEDGCLDVVQEEQLKTEKHEDGWVTWYTHESYFLDLNVL